MFGVFLPYMIYLYGRITCNSLIKCGKKNLSKFYIGFLNVILGWPMGRHLGVKPTPRA